jgi:hypothetical protein
MLRPTRLLPLLVVLGIAAAPSVARADVGLGLFVGQPTGLDLKLGLSAKSALDIVLGLRSFDEDSGGYGHLTYLVTPFVSRGRSVIVPFRIGIGAAIFESGGDDDLAFAVRAPFEVGFVFNRNVEIYGEIAFKISFNDDRGDDDDIDADLDGGLGFRIYF